MTSLADEIKRRTHMDQATAELNAALAERYSAEVTIQSFGPKFFQITDNKGRTVSIADSQIREDILHVFDPRTEIVILSAGSPPAIIGWTHKDNLRDAEDRFIVSTKSLYPLPNEFDFARPCPHLDVYGGLYIEQDKAWECLGCGIEILAH